MERFSATRLAPSPTGALHLGHARTFLITWWMARQAGAKIYMRMDDIDAVRAKPESVQQAYDDLRWLGMTWDEYGGTQNDERGTMSAVVQSERGSLYEAALEKLWRAGAVYPCVCRRAEIVASVAAGAGAPHEGEGHPRYPGTCREKLETRHSKLETMHDVVTQVFEQTGRGACFRLRVEEGTVGFRDEIAGEQRFDVFSEAGDFPVTRFAEVGSGGATTEHRRDADATVVIPPAYQLACVVDDHAMGIDMVIRGDDLLASTPRQMLLYQALRYDVPRFAHVPLVIGADGKRLAKRHGESRIAQFRQAGVSAERVIGWVAWRSGQLERPLEISAYEMMQKFDLVKLPRERVVLGAEDLAWLR